MLVQYVALGLLAVTAVFVIFNLLKGLIRGFKKTIGSLVAIILSAIIAAVVTLFVCTPTSPLVSAIIAFFDTVLTDPSIQELLAISEVAETLTYYVAMVVAPFFFIALYIVLSLILAIVASIVCKFIPPKVKRKGALHRVGGLAVGAVCGLVVSLIIIMPVAGILDIAATAGEAILALDTPAEGESSDTEEIKQIVSELSSNEIIGVYQGSTGWLFDMMTSAQFGENRIHLKDDVAAIVAIAPNLGALNAEDMTQFGSDQVDALDGIVDGLNKSMLFKNVIAGVVSEAAGKWNEGETFMGMEKISAGELLDPMVNSMVGVFATTTKDTISQDLRSVTGVFGVLIDHDVLSNMENYDVLLNKLGKEGVIGELILEVNKNERMSVISDEITKLSVRALATTLEIPANSEALYDQVMVDIVDTLNNSRFDSDRVSSVAEGICNTFENHGIEITAEEATVVAESLVSDLGNISGLQAESVEEFFLVYSASATAPDEDSAYTGTGSSFSSLATVNSVTGNSNGTITIGDRVLDSGIYNNGNYKSSAAYRMGLSGESIGDAAYLYSAKKMGENSKMVTLEGIMAHIRKYSECDDPNAEAQKISEMFAIAADLFADGGLEGMTYDQLIGEVGALLDKMNETQIFGKETINNVMTAILQSNSVKQEMGLTVKEASDFSEKLNNLVSEEKSYSDITNTVSNTIGMINSVNDDSISKEERIENTKELIKDIDHDTADMLSQMVTPSTIVKYGTPEDKAQVVSDSVTTLFTNMADFSADPDSEEYHREADAVNKVLDLALKNSDVEDGEVGMFNDENGTGKLDTTADELVSTIIGSEVVSATIMDAAKEDDPYGIQPGTKDKEELTAAMDAYYAENSEGKTAEELAELQNRLNALASITNLPAMFPEAENNTNN